MGRIATAALLAAAALLLQSCIQQPTSGAAASRELGIDLSDVESVECFDSYEAGEGASCTAFLIGDETAFEARIDPGAGWEAIPFDDTARSLLYGIETGSGREGPYLADAEGSPVVPVVVDGYYLIVDRHSGRSEENLLDRGSINATVGVYDSDGGVLYFCRLDT